MAYPHYDPEAYEALTSERKGARAFDHALATADAATLIRAYCYVIEEADGEAVSSIGRRLCDKHGFTDDDLQLVAEMKNPASPAARSALGLQAPAPASGLPASDLPPMETTTHEQASTTFRQPAELPDHPLLAHIPVWAPHEPEFQALKISILERGVDYPVLVDSAGRVVDGRNRRNACAAAGLPVPTRTVADDQVANTIVSALGNRRHVSKGAMAYLLAPLLKPAIEESRRYRESNLKQLATDSSLSELSKNKTVEAMADGLGFGRTVFFQALKIHEKFAENPELKQQFEEQILTGILGLGGAIQAIAGKLATEDKPRVVRPADELLLRAFTDLRNRWDGYAKLPDEKRDEVKAQVAAAAAEWPADVAAATAAAWRKAGLIS